MRLTSGITGDFALITGTKGIGNFGEFADRHLDYQAGALTNLPSPARDHTAKELQETPTGILGVAARRGEWP
jgi:hypothetical protein